MKLIYAIISDDDVKSVTGELNQEGFYATRLSSGGSFLRSGNTTLMICTEDELVDQAISIIKENSCERKMLAPDYLSMSAPEMSIPVPVEVTVGGATIMVVNVERFEKA